MTSGNNERLASLETKLKFMMDLFQEVREDLKTIPTKEDYDQLKSRLDDEEKNRREIENNQNKLIIKAGIASGILGFIGGLALRYILG